VREQAIFRVQKASREGICETDSFGQDAPVSVCFRPPKQIITCTVTKIALNVGENVPAEIVDVEEFVSTSERAEYCSVKRMKDSVKLKLRTSSKLYTMKIEPLKAEEIIKKLQCEIREI
jgi:hypothetical protein